MDYTHIARLAEQIPDIPTDSIVSRTLFSDGQLKAILFGFAAGQELSEHTASQAAILHFLQGEADVMLGADKISARAGTWIHMPPHLSHSVAAKTQVVMLLLMLKGPMVDSSNG
ncbi:MAG: cupin domain-containing protein [Anaerolineae bacterium]